MIYLYTGKPGIGKTLNLISMIAKEDIFKTRPLYIDGIEILDCEKISYQEMPDGCNAGNWQDWLPDGAILVVDECQRYWRPRPNGSKVPDAVVAMETHRHKGVDIYLITQMPSKIDKSIRELIEAHKHFSKSPLGIRRVMEWTRCGNPEIKGDVQTALIRPYTLDKSCYGLYKSSVQHNEAREPKSLVRFLIPLFFIGGIALTIWAVMGIFGEDSPFRENQKRKQTTTQYKTTQQNTNTIQNDNKQNESNGLIDRQQDNMKKGVINGFTGEDIKKASEPEINPNNEENNSSTNNQLKESDFEPSIKGQPWTAKAYSHLSNSNNFKTMPYPVGCVKSGTRCTCYTEQATIIDMDKKVCLNIIKNGLYNPYKSNNISSEQEK